MGAFIEVIAWVVFIIFLIAGDCHHECSIRIIEVAEHPVLLAGFVLEPYHIDTAAQRAGAGSIPFGLWLKPKMFQRSIKICPAFFRDLFASPSLNNVFASVR
jgi:hypothetical protein